MLSIVPPSNFKEVEIQRIIRATVKKKSSNGIPTESISSKSIVWMPYNRIQFEYRRPREDSIRELGETAINAMFCGCTQSENELFSLFRPNYLKYKMITYTPQLNEIIAPTFPANFDAILSGFLQRLNEIKKELNEARSTLNKRYVHIRRHSLILPTMGGLKESERLAGKIAKLSALTNVFSMCLNLSEDAESIKALHNSTFYYPTAVGAFGQEKSEAKQFLIVDLVKKGVIHKSLSCDEGLTQLCSKNDACNKVLAKFVASK